MMTHDYDSRDYDVTVRVDVRTQAARRQQIMHGSRGVSDD